MATLRLRTASDRWPLIALELFFAVGAVAIIAGVIRSGDQTTSTDVFVLVASASVLLDAVLRALTAVSVEGSYVRVRNHFHRWTIPVGDVAAITVIHLDSWFSMPPTMNASKSQIVLDLSDGSRVRPTALSGLSDDVDGQARTDPTVEKRAVRLAQALRVPLQHEPYEPPS